MVKNAIILFGFLENWVFMKEIAILLNDLGYRVHTDWGYQSIKDLEYNIKTLEEYLVRNDLKNILLVGHSKGGNLALRAIEKSSLVVNRVDGIITIATGYRGTKFGVIKVLALDELIYGQNFEPESTVDIPILNLYPALDNHIIPNSSLRSISKNVQNVEIDIVGHTRVLRSPEASEQIKKFLKEK